MAEVEKYLVFLCSAASKAMNKKLSYRIAAKLESMGKAEIGTLQNLSEQHALDHTLQKRMIFINDCRSGCVNVLTHGFDKSKFIYFDVSPFNSVVEFDIEHFISSEIIPKIIEKWFLSPAATINPGATIQ
jgi:hypothetical protein